MSVSRVMIDVLVKRGFSISDIAKLAEVDRSAVSHVYHGTTGYSGKKIQKRLATLLGKTGYTKEEHKRIQDALYKRTTFTLDKESRQEEETKSPIAVVEPIKVEIPRVRRITNERVTMHNCGHIAMKWVKDNAYCTICNGSIFGATYSMGMINGTFVVFCMGCLEKYREHIKPIPSN